MFARPASLCSVSCCRVTLMALTPPDGWRLSSFSKCFQVTQRFLREVSPTRFPTSSLLLSTFSDQLLPTAGETCSTSTHQYDSSINHQLPPTCALINQFLCGYVCSPACRIFISSRQSAEQRTSLLQVASSPSAHVSCLLIGSLQTTDEPARRNASAHHR